MYIYLDESGNLTVKNGQYFIVGSYTVGDPRRIAKHFVNDSEVNFLEIGVTGNKKGAALLVVVFLS